MIWLSGDFNTPNVTWQTMAILFDSPPKPITSDRHYSRLQHVPNYLSTNLLEQHFGFILNQFSCINSGRTNNTRF